MQTHTKHFCIIEVEFFRVQLKFAFRIWPRDLVLILFLSEVAGLLVSMIVYQSAIF